MGKRGPQKTPTAILEARGSWRAVEREKTEPKFAAVTDLAAPTVLPAGPALAEWKRLAPMLARSGVLTEADRGTLVGYCLSWATVVEAQSAMSEQGSAAMFSGKQSWLAVRKDALSQLRQFAADLGISPASRSSVIASAGKKAKTVEVPVKAGRATGTHGKNIQIKDYQ